MPEAVLSLPFGTLLAGPPARCSPGHAFHVGFGGLDVLINRWRKRVRGKKQEHVPERGSSDCLLYTSDAADDM
eukprot:7544543-Alexandrium_andersonii.AAC.1